MMKLYTSSAGRDSSADGVKATWFLEGMEDDITVDKCACTETVISLSLSPSPSTSALVATSFSSLSSFSFGSCFVISPSLFPVLLWLPSESELSNGKSSPLLDDDGSLPTCELCTPLLSLSCPVASTAPTSAASAAPMSLDLGSTFFAFFDNEVNFNRSDGLKHLYLYHQWHYHYHYDYHYQW